MRLPLILFAASFLAYSQPADRHDQHARNPLAVMVSLGVTFAVMFSGAALDMKKRRPATHKK